MGDQTNGGRSSYKADEDYYLQRMKEILNSQPNTGPPLYPVKLLEHVYIGNQRNADNVELLKRYGVTHVLNCAGLRRYDFTRSPYPKDSGIKGFLMISAEDREDFNIGSHFEEAIEFLERVKKTKGRALVHCNLGVNRSGAVVAAYLMVEQRRTLLEVTNYLKLKRSVILCNKGFRRQLVQFARSRGLLEPIIQCSNRSVSDSSEIQHEKNNSSRPSINSEIHSKQKTSPVTIGQQDGTESLYRFVASQDVSPSTSPSLSMLPIDGSDKSDNGKQFQLPPTINMEWRPQESVSDKLFSKPGTLPRQTSTETCRSVPPIDVIVSEHVDPMTNGYSKSAVPLTPVYETSFEAFNSLRTPPTGAESVSNRLGNFLTMLSTKRKPLRSTSYSNVSSQQSMTTVGTGTSSVGAVGGTTALSTSRPLRVYTRSSTDSEIYRTRTNNQRL